MTETQTKWLERVREWKASGQTARSFAQGRDFKPTTLTYWAYRLRQAGQQSTGAAVVDESLRPSVLAPQIPIVRVQRTGVHWPSLSKQAAAGPETSSATMAIAVGAARIEVRSGFVHELLAEVVDALGDAR
jgi:hypothetical protein